MASITEFLTREDWLAARRTGLGGSDMAAILGVSPWRGPHDVYAEKTGLITDDRQTEAMHWGTVLEDPIAAEWRSRNNLRFRRLICPLVRDEEDPFLFGSPDRMIYPERLKAGLEIKTAGARSMKGWGEEWTDQIPSHYLIQCQHYLMVTGCTTWYVAALLGGQEYREYVVRVNEELQRVMRARARSFWRSVLDREPPPLDASDGAKAMVEGMFPKHDADVVLPEGPDTVTLLSALVARRAERKALDGVIQEFETRLKAEIGEHRGLKWDGGRVSWATSRGAIQWKMVAEALGGLTEEHVDLVESHRAKSYRRFAVTPKKQEVADGESQAGSREGG